MSKIRILIVLLVLFLTACASSQPVVPVIERETPIPLLATVAPGKVPNFDHIIVIVLENRAYDAVIGNQDMPNLNGWAQSRVLLTNYFGVRHPSLPNYIAMIGGDTFNITKDCTTCWVNQPSLPDLIEKSGRSWKTYQEDIPSPCFIGNKGKYMQKHNPFIYFDPIRTNTARCEGSVVPLSQLNTDLVSGKFPNFAFITPNMCHSGHDCNLKVVDDWLKTVAEPLEDSVLLGPNTLIVITFDEGEGGKSTCCDLPVAGGHIPTILISPLAKSKFQDSTPLSHYSLLKTILRAWDLPDLGQTANPANQPILAPWGK